MTCFWDGLMNGLQDNDFKPFNEKKTNRNNLIKLLKKHNKETLDILWNGIKIHDKELKENFIAVRDYDESKINNGHLCSTGDYMLALICSIFNINIYHQYLQKTMKYEKPTNTINLYVRSDKGHFWFVSRN